MYTDRNFKTKKAMREAFERGESIFVHQPGPFGEGGHIGHVGAVHQCALEGPHYPQPHTWYASGFYAIASSQLIELNGSKAKWVNGVFVPAPPKVTRAKRVEPTVDEQVERNLRLQSMSDRIDALPAPKFHVGDRIVYSGLRGRDLHGTVSEYQGFERDHFRYRVVLEWPGQGLHGADVVEDNLTKEV